MNNKNRIQLTDSIGDVFTKLAEGNFGALSVLKLVMQKGGEIDPDCGFGDPVFQLLSFDSYGIYGSKIWMLYKDVCGENINKTLACLRAMQMGIVPESVMKYAIENRGVGINMSDLCKQVKECLPNFKMGNELDAPKTE